MRSMRKEFITTFWVALTFATAFLFQNCGGFVWIDAPKLESLSSATAEIRVKAANDLGSFNPYLFGYANSPTEDSIELAQASGFKLSYVAYYGDGKICGDDFMTDNDEEIEALMAAGITPMPLFDPKKKPDDLDAYATCVKKVGQHLFDKGVTIFRFSNEPDGSWTYWGKEGAQSDPVDVAKTYEVWANALKSVSASIIVEGPAIMIIMEDGQIADWVRRFLDYCRDHDVPLDIFSFHVYSENPYVFYKKFEIVKEELKKYPISPLYGVPKLGNDEWLLKVGDAWSGRYTEQFDKTWGAAAQISGLINMIDAGVALSVPTFGINIETEYLCHDFLPISCSGKAKPAFYAFQAFNQLAETNQLEVSGTDRMNFTAISGVKEVSGDKQIMVILSNYDVEAVWQNYNDGDKEILAIDGISSVSDIENAQVYNRYNLKIENVPWQTSELVTVSRYLIDDNNALVLAEKGEQQAIISNDGSIAISAEISVPQIQILTFSLKGKSSLFDLTPELEPDENYGELDTLGKQSFERSRGVTARPGPAEPSN